jgi:nucleoside-diphosphate-sugar epimerase
MRVLLTGATGHIGRNLAERLSDEGYDITAVVRDSSDTSVLPIGTDVVVCGIDDANAFAAGLNGKKYDIFFDLAWPGSSGAGRSDEAVQADSAASCAERSRAAVMLGCRRYVFTGTIAQYYLRNGADIRGTENFYGAAKERAGSVTRDICRSGGVEHVAVLPASVYGKGATAGLVHRMVACMKNGDPVPLTDADALTDLVHISDAVNGIFLAGIEGKDGASYFVGSGTPMTVREYADAAKDVIGSSSELRFGDVPSYGILKANDLSIEPLSNDTGYSPAVRFADGLRTLL